MVVVVVVLVVLVVFEATTQTVGMNYGFRESGDIIWGRFKSRVMPVTTLRTAVFLPHHHTRTADGCKRVGNGHIIPKKLTGL